MTLQSKKNGNTKKFVVTGCVWLLAVLGLTALVIAQEADPSVVPAAEPASEVSVTGQASAVSSVQSLQSISFRKDMPIKDALQMLAQMYHKNIVPSARVDGLVTVTNLYDVTFEEALQAVLGTHKYEIKGNFVRVYTNEEFMADRTRFEREMITLYYINAEEARKLAEPLLSEFGQLGVTTAAMSDLKVGSGGDSLSIRDRLVVKDYPEVLKSIREIIAQVDVQPPQVLVEVTVLKCVLDETTEFGIDFDVLDVKFSSYADTPEDFGDFVSQGGFTPESTSGLSIGILEDHVRVLISALESITDTTLLANPKILALNKQAGMVMIGDRKGYITTSNIGPEGATQQVEFLEGGTQLAFRPFVCRDGLIRMEIYPKQSTPVVVVDQGYVLPSESTTEVQTNIMVKDGKTIVIGGLFKEETNLTRSQVPLLGDLPVVGDLFRGTSDVSIRTELIVLLTPHIINDPEEAEGAGREQDMLRLTYNARENLTWMSRARIDEERYSQAVKYYMEGNYECALAILNSPFAIQRNWLDSIRLKERILREARPEDYQQMERLMMKKIEEEESGKWDRR